MSLSQVVPAEAEGQEDNTESIDLFEVLEERYAYEGFNKFAFYCFWFLAMYQWALCSWHYPDAAAATHKLRKGLMPSKDQFERKEFNHWGIKTMEVIVNDPDFFGDEYKLTRATLQLRPTLCNHTSWHTLIVVVILLLGIGAFGHIYFGIYGGSYDFKTLGLHLIL